VDLELEDNLRDWKVCPQKKHAKCCFFIDLIHNYWNGLGFLWRGYLVHHNCLLGNICTTLLISSPLGLGTKNETYNVLALRCLGNVEPNTLVIVQLKPLVKLKFGFGIMP
jgi:hypothetical protein